MLEEIHVVCFRVFGALGVYLVFGSRLAGWWDIGTAVGILFNTFRRR